MEEFLASATPHLVAASVIAFALAKTVETIVRSIAPLTKNKTDDKMVEWFDEKMPSIEDAVDKVKAWADPKNPDVPTGPPQ